MWPSHMPPGARADDNYAWSIEQFRSPQIILMPGGADFGRLITRLHTLRRATEFMCGGKWTLAIGRWAPPRAATVTTMACS